MYERLVLGTENAPNSRRFASNARCLFNKLGRGVGRTLLIPAALALLLPFAAGRPTEAQTAPAYSYFPTASTTDARMMSLGGSPIETLAGEVISAKIMVPAGTASFELGFFDGDTGKDDAGALNPAGGNWDLGTAQLVYQLFADPAGDGTGTTLLATWQGNGANPLSGAGWVASAATMPNNDWWSATIQNVDAARIPVTGEFSYNLVVSLSDPNATVSSNFKLRSTGRLRVRTSALAFEAASRSLHRDGPIIYPEWDGVTAPPEGSNYWLVAPTTYDGNWSFNVEVPANVTDFIMWDGDFDYGTGQLVGYPSGQALEDVKDSDDPDTVAVPDWAPGTIAQAEGAKGTGFPPEDTPHDYARRSPSVTYEVVDPTGKIYRNLNPSGNLEWEQFRITTDPTATRSTADYAPNVSSDGSTVVTGSTLPAGIWQIRIAKLDIGNTVFVRFPFQVTGVDDGGGPQGPPVVEHECGKVTGGGWIPLPSGQRGNNKGTFGVHAMCAKGETVKGNINYVDHVNGIHVKSRTVTRLEIVGDEAKIYGTASVNGAGTYDFIVTVNDFAEPGAGSDRFGIQLSNGYSYSAGVTVLGGGNIQIHKAK